MSLNTFPTVDELLSFATMSDLFRLYHKADAAYRMTNDVETLAIRQRVADAYEEKRAELVIADAEWSRRTFGHDGLD